MTEIKGEEFRHSSYLGCPIIIILDVGFEEGPCAVMKVSTCDM
jgi:hypothetical protein